VNRRLAAVFVMAWAMTPLLGGAVAAKTPARSASRKKTKAPVRRTVAVPRVTAAQRAAARNEVASQLNGENLTVENPAALTAFYEALQPDSLQAQPVHILQFGDSHTASDDWVHSMRTLLQTRFGDGGPGFVQAGRPYRGYRRFDAHGNNSPGWSTEGTMALRGDPYQGLSGVSISTGSAGQTVTLSATGEGLNVFYLRQPGGGALELTDGNQSVGTIQTSGETGPGVATFSLAPGAHELTLRTLDRAPVRLFGWTVENKAGLTFETLGINGAQANVLLGWSEPVWAAAMAARKPALVILAYGTNEANSPRWAAQTFRTDLEGVLERVRQAAPQASILLVGPPDCGRLHPLAHLAEVIALQREIAREQNVAFWDWRQHMGGPGAIRRWVAAGYAQTDYIHMTGEGYRMVGEMIVTALLENPRAADTPHRADLEKHDEQAGQSH
jgi:lysophospholipase L1-like esterase